MTLLVVQCGCACRIVSRGGWVCGRFVSGR